MNFRDALKRSEAVSGLVHDTRKLLKIPAHVETLVGRSKVVRRYFASNPIRKLEIGAGPTARPGWLGTDIAPRSEGVIRLDATKCFPFADNSFDYVYSEHMIEHISWKDGQHMLKECHRVLKPGGAIRIATPDLAVLLSLYVGTDHPLGERYVRWITDAWLEGVPAYRAVFVINNAFRNWGHQFLYDGEMAQMALQNAGFTSIRRYAPGQSDDPQLRGIESHGQNIASAEMADFETMVYEALRP